MAHVCPWWFVRSFDNPVRRVFHDPARLFGSWVHAGMRVLDVGCGAGFNAEGLARLVGPKGKVVGVDLQPRMLAMTEQRLKRSKLVDRAELIEASVDDLKLQSLAPFEFAVAFWMVHEVKDVERFFHQLREALLPGATLLICEPKLHVLKRAFERNVRAARRVGFEERSRPKIRLSHAALFTNP
jgi:ubiquinone/menaquinone biosynthesis C-methylase UbiE